jgi:hypothetical protein
MINIIIFLILRVIIKIQSNFILIHVMNVKIFGKNVLNIMHFFVVFQFNIHNVQKLNY